MSEELSEESFWSGMIKKYWYALLIYCIGFIGAIVGVILVFLRYIGDPGIAGGGTWTFADFSVGYLILWCIFLILWELLLVGLPVIAYLAIVTAIFWFVVLSEEDKTAIKGRERKERKIKKTSGGSGAAGFLFFIAFICVLAIDGRLFIPFNTPGLYYTYFIFAYLVGVMWTLIVLGIPVLIIVIIYYGYKESKKRKSV
ncbi:MAG: hypothetical protein ACFE8E_06615 [Candidatus Hodarchaeota archaeon]